MTVHRDTVDFAEVLGALRHGWRWILGGVVAGFALAAVVTVLLRPQYEGLSTVLLRSEQPGAGVLSGSSEGVVSLGGLAGILSGATGFDTELEILTSRSTIGAVVDSLGLQAVVLEPEATSPMELFAAASWDPQSSDATYSFRRAGDGFQVSGPGVESLAQPGVPYRLGRSIVTLRPGELPDEFEIRLTSRQKAIDSFQKRLDADQAAGEIAELTFRADDPITAAAAPNALVQKYLERRRTTDRGVNQRRYEFLSEHTDSIRTELARAESALRAQQEQSGVLDPQVFGEAELEHALELQAELDAVRVEARAFREVLSRAATGDLAPRSLAAYPTFLQNPAINDLLSRLQVLETERTALLDRRTERDPDVVVLDEQIEQLEGQLVSLSRSYLDGLSRQEAQLGSEVQRYGDVLARLPAQAQAHYRLAREVGRLSETLVALQTQLVQARLAAMAEGGDVRQVDVAVAPEDPAFPRRLLNLAIGLLGGLLFGCVAALATFYGGSRIRVPSDVALVVDLPVVPASRADLLLLKGPAAHGGVLVLPAGAGADTTRVAHDLVAASALQGTRPVVAELEHPEAGPSAEASAHADPGERAASTALTTASRGGGEYLIYPGSNGAGLRALRQRLDELRESTPPVVVALPGIEVPVARAVLAMRWPSILVVRLGTTTRAELHDAARTLGDLEVPVLGVVVQDHQGNA